jgi:hypothetical protein
MKFILVVLAFFVTMTTARAAPTDVVYQGGGTVTGTAGCPGWNPLRQFFHGTYWVPVASSTNGPDSVITFHFGNGTAEGFELRNGVFTTDFKTVLATHVYTRTGTYPASLRILSRAPVTITTATQTVAITGTVRGWDRQPNCHVNFTMMLVRDLNP